MKHNRNPMKAQVGDVVQYVLGMPGPDYDEGTVEKVNEDGSFDLTFGPETYSALCGVKRLKGLRLSDHTGRIHVGYVAKVTRPGVNGF